jgi:hypothetical protein
MKEITINTVQGIGDLIWVYRKLSLLYDKINFNVLVTKHDDVQRRAGDFLRILDKTGSISFKKVRSAVYSRVASGFYTTDKIDREYSVNAWLEKGIHIASIDSNPVNWDIGLRPELFNNKKEYLLLYISGCRHIDLYHQMSSSDWAKITEKVCSMLGLNKCILIGAPYDRDKLVETKQAFNTCIDVSVITEASISQTMGIISQAGYFISYQSGLSVIAEEFNVPTLMIYFPENRKLIHTWLRKENLDTGLFKNCFFGDSLESIINDATEHINRKHEYVID